MDEEIKKEFEKVWKKIRELEQEKNLRIVSKTSKDKFVKTKKDYNGLAGGIRLLIDENFLNVPKSVKEIQEELKRQGYYHSKTSVAKLLSVDFMKKKRIITRIDENKRWKYVIRK